MTCKQCARVLTPDEIALHKRLINRGATEHLCITCLAAWFSCSEEVLQEKIAFYRRIGCMLFRPEADQP